MLKRRNVRIKVMQLYYAQLKNQQPDKKILKKELANSIHGAYRLYLFQLSLLKQLAQHTHVFADIQAAKYQDERRKDVSTAFLDNPILQCLAESEALQKWEEKEALKSLIPDNLLRKLFRNLSDFAPYKVYQDEAIKSAQDHRQIVLDVLDEVVISESEFQDCVADHFIHFSDDFEICKSHLIKSLKTCLNKGALEISEENFQENLDFGFDLLISAITKETENQALVEPKLNNWEFDRVARLDFILINLALCELTHFPEIPVKVTINEYLEIAKNYSSSKSKDFVNGVIDRLYRDLNEQGKIQKSGRGLIG